MKASELIKLLQKGVEQYGNHEVAISADSRAEFLYYYEYPGLVKEFWLTDYDRSEDRCSHRIDNESE